MLKKLIILLFVSVPLLAQDFALQDGYPKQWGDGYEWYFYGNDIDSGTTQSNIIDISDFDADLSLNPMGWYLEIDTTGSSDGAGIIVGIKVQGKANWSSNYVDLADIIASDTIYSDSSNAHSALTSLKANGATNLNEANEAFPQIRFLITVTSASSNTADYKLGLYARKRD